LRAAAIQHDISAVKYLAGGKFGMLGAARAANSRTSILSI
jgi:hypothetical protein